MSESYKKIIFSEKDKKDYNVNNNNFPIGRLIWASFFGGIRAAPELFLNQFTSSSELFNNSNIVGFWQFFFFSALIQCCFSFIPIFIAYTKQSKHRNSIYNLSTIFPIIVLIISAIIWAICDKKEPEKINKKRER